MRLKTELYKKEQDIIVSKIINILNLTNNTTTLYEIDLNKNKIMELIPDIRKYFSFSSITGASKPRNLERPWLSIIKQILRPYYFISSQDHRIYKENNEVIRTIIYKFTKK